MASRDNDFLARWSRRKVEARGGLRRRQDDDAARPAPARRPSAPEVKPAETASQRNHNVEPADPADPRVSFAEELRREEEAPVVAVNRTPAAHEDEFASLTEEQRAEFADVDFDRLTPDDDFSRFMKEDVPEIVRRRALRALWSHPVISSVDRLNDYDEDFTDAALAVRVLSSSYKPGSGYLTEEERVRYNMDEGEVSTEVAETPEDEDAQAKTAETDGAAADGDGESGEDSVGDADGDAGEFAEAGTRGAGGRAPQTDEKS